MAEQFSLSLIFKLEDRATGPLRNLGRNLETFGNQAMKVGKQMESVGRKMSTYLTLPIAGAFTFFTKKAIDFESAFTGVRKTVDASEPEFQALYQGFVDLGKQIPIATTELMGIGEAAGQLGIETPNILKFTKVMADLGVTTNLAGKEAATTLARFTNITQMSQGDFDRLGSTIVALGNNLATTEAEIADMSLRLAGAGHQIGLSEPQILSLAGALSSLGLQAEAGGTAFSRVMVGMNKAISTGGKELMIFSKVAGVAPSEFQKAFKEDAIGTILQFIEGLKGLQDQGKNVSLILDALGFDGVRVADALLRASGSGDLVRRSIELGNKAWKENTALTREAELRYKTTASQLRLFKNALDRLAVSFGNEALPFLTKLVKNLGDMFDWLSTLSPAVKKLILFVGLFVAIIGPLAVIIGLVAQGMGALAIAIAGTSLAALGAAGTLGLVAAAIIGIIAGLGTVIAYWDKLKVTFSGDFWQTWAEGIGIIADKIWDIIKAFFALEAPWNKVKHIFSAISDSVKLGYGAIGGILGLSNEGERLDAMGQPRNVTQSLNVSSQNKSEVTVNVKAENGTQAKVGGVNGTGKTNVNVMGPGYLGNTAPAGG